MEDSGGSNNEPTKIIAPQPSVYKMADDLVSAWDDAPNDGSFAIVLDKEAVNELFEAIRTSYYLTSAVQRSLAAILDGRRELANDLTQEAADLTVEGLNALKRFMAALIRATIRPTEAGSKGSEHE